MATVKTETKKTGNTVQAKADARVVIPDARRGLYAYVGVADLAVEKLKTLPELQEQVVEGIKTQVRELPQTLRTALSDVAGKVNETYTDASEQYSELADRGEKLVTSIRRAPATRRAQDQVKTAKAQTKGARTSVRKAADSSVAAAESAGNKIG